MDGYAMRCEDVVSAGAVLSVSQRIPAGSVGTALQAGTAARIFTGASIPAGADAVVMQEECEILPDIRRRESNSRQRRSHVGSVDSPCR